jgi:hypothetical protein
MTKDSGTVLNNTFLKTINLSFKMFVFSHLYLEWADLGSGIPPAPRPGPEKAAAVGAGGGADAADAAVVAVDAAEDAAAGPLRPQLPAFRCGTAGSRSPAPWA